MGFLEFDGALCGVQVAPMWQNLRYFYQYFFKCICKKNCFFLKILYFYQKSLKEVGPELLGMKMDHLSSRLTNQILIEGPDFNLLSYQSNFKFNYINLEVFKES